VNIAQRLLIGVVQGYRLLLKPWLGNACRFEPTCSAYTLQALQQHGAWRGTALGGWRLLRCHPWCDGGLDPVPDTFALRRGGAAGGGLFTGLLAEPAGGPVMAPTTGTGAAPDDGAPGARVAGHAPEDTARPAPDR
jgi:putative membrane protein insertion efficiency factor